MSGFAPIVTMAVYVVLTVNSPSTFCCWGGACLSTIHDRATDSNNLYANEINEFVITHFRTFMAI